jgi:transposase
METDAIPADSDCPRCRALEARLRVLEGKLRDLEDRLKGPPPKREPGVIAPPAKKSPSGKKPGGQTGHPPHIRKWLAKERVTKTVAFVPTHCLSCDHALPAAIQPGDPAPTIHQTYELPTTLIDVTQYEGHARTCPQCAAVTHRAIPAEHRTTILQPKLAAMILHQSGVLGLSKRDIEATLETVFDLPISLGTIANLEQEASAALAPTYQAIRSEVDQAPVKGLDETGWKQAGKKRWLWVAATLRAVLFRIHPRRNENALADLIPSRTGIAVSDRWKTYTHWPLDRRQLCWAHLNRNWDKLAEQVPAAKDLRQRWIATKDALFRDWHRFRDGTLTREHWTEKIRVHQKYITLVLSHGMTHANRKVASFCERLHALIPAAFTFGRLHGVEPTNNHTERVQRRAVLWRRTSFGCHSEPGCRFVERLLSVVETLKLRGRSVLAFLTQAIEGARAGQPVTAMG